MAIDDNTTYGLTGAQVKELPEKINALKGMAKKLTSADYNWPTSSPDGIALWLLPSGVYYADTGTKCYNGSSSTFSNAYRLFLVGVKSEDSVVPGNPQMTSVFGFNGQADNSNNNGPLAIMGYRISDNGASRQFANILSTQNIINNLTSTYTLLPLSARQGKALKDLVDSLAIRGAGAPTTSTAGQVGTLYEDTTNGKLYICTDATNPYVWEEVGGGGGPIVVQTTGTSTTDVMSQNATTSMVFQDPSARTRVQIGNSANANAGYAIAIGQDSGVGSVTTAASSISIGADSRGRAKGAIALGAYSGNSNTYSMTQGEMHIGTRDTSYGYNNSNYRLLRGLYDPQTDNDAATKGYVDGMITLTDTDPGEGSALAAGKYVAVYGEDPLIMDYSTSEVNTGMKWIDGKVIYKKTINNLNMPTSSSHTAATAHSITGLDKVIKTEGSLINANGEAFQLGYGDGSNNDTVLYVGSTNVNIYSVADKSAWTGFVTLYYTKTSS